MQALKQSQADYQKDAKIQELQKLMRSLQLQVWRVMLATTHIYSTVATVPSN
jgi:hypothetical protein